MRKRRRRRRRRGGGGRAGEGMTLRRRGRYEDINVVF